MQYKTTAPARSNEQRELHDINQGTHIKYKCDKSCIFHDDRGRRLVLSVYNLYNSHSLSYSEINSPGHIAFNIYQSVAFGGMHFITASQQ